MNILNRLQLFFLKKTITPSELMNFANRFNGIGIYGTEEETGEVYVLEDIVAKKYFNKNPIIFDVGANVGNYALLVKKYIPHAHVYAFEPNKKAYDQLVIATTNTGVAIKNIGFGETIRTADLYSFTSLAGTELGTSDPTVLSTLYGKDVHDSVEKISFEMDTLDHYCTTHDITHIHFLKIDVEGYEKNVLSGATDMLAKGAIDMIQFEFNNLNLEYHVRLKDFYTLLPNYSFFRITPHGTIALGPYTTANEVFQYQNILAIKND